MSLHAAPLKPAAALFAALTLTGCPDQTPVTQTVAVTPDEVPVLVDSDPFNGAGDRVYFDYDSHQLRPDAQQTLQKQAVFIQEFRDYRVLIEGHCDERGTRDYNLALGERRADTIKNYLIALGVDAGRIETVGFGKERPEAIGDDDASWALNRRGVTVLAGE